MPSRSPDEPHSEEQRWRDIVLELGGSDTQATAPAPVDRTAHQHGETSTTATPRGPRDYTLAEEPDDDFVPATPRPIFSGSPRAVLSWVTVIGIPLIFFVLWVLPGVQLSWWFTTGLWFAWFGAAVSLFYLLPRDRYSRRDSDDDYGSGARV